jgi:homoserine kinase type II
MGSATKMDSVTQRVLAEEYNLGQVLFAERLGGTRNLNFVVQTMNGKYVARQRHPAYCEVGQMQFDHDVLEHLKKQGAAVVEAMTTRKGWRICRNGTAIWELSPYVVGNHYEEGKPENAAQLGVALATLHRAGSSFPERYKKEEPRGALRSAALALEADKLAKRCPDTVQELERYRLWIRAGEAVLPDADYNILPQTITHGDIQPSNIITREGRVAAFVDFDKCAWRPRVWDLAPAVLYCCTTHAEAFIAEDLYAFTQEPTLQRDCVSRFLQGYELISGPLSPKEMAGINAQMILLWCHCRIAGALRVPIEDAVAFLSRGPLELASLQV